MCVLITASELTVVTWDWTPGEERMAVAAWRAVVVEGEAEVLPRVWSWPEQCPVTP